MTRAVALLALVLLAACGVPEDGAPRAITGTVPFQLLEPRLESTATTTPESDSTTRVTIHLTDAEGRLVETRREVAAPATAEKVIEVLLGGPTEAEADDLSTQITQGTMLLGIEGPVDGLVTIDLSRQLLDITGRPQILALAQVVYTVTALEAVDRVLFEFEGQRAEVPNINGELTSSPVGRLSYRGLLRG